MMRCWKKALGILGSILLKGAAEIALEEKMNVPIFK
jgi:hypothetical protein